MVGFLGLAWIAFVVGVVVGWAWKPKWAGGGRDKLACFPVPKMVFVLNFRINSFKLRRTISGPWGSGNKVDKEPLVAAPPVNDANCSVSRATSEESFVMPERESKHLYQLVELKDGGPAWVKMMDQSTPNMGYQAWRRDPETGPQYHSTTIFEDVMPELVRDFFWDDGF